MYIVYITCIMIFRNLYVTLYIHIICVYNIYIYIYINEHMGWGAAGAPLSSMARGGGGASLAEALHRASECAWDWVEERGWERE